MQQVFQGWVKKCTLSRMVRFGGNWQYYVTPKNETGLHMDGFKRRSRGQNWKIKEKKKQQQPQDTIVAKELDRAEVRHTFKNS